MAESQAATNTPEISVTELSSALKRTIEDRFAFVRLLRRDHLSRVYRRHHQLVLTEDDVVEGSRLKR